MRSDVDLLEAWRGGDQPAGADLFNRHFRSLYLFFRNKSMDGIDDLVQQTFLGCLEGRDRMRSDASFRAYMYAVARNQLYRYWHKRDKTRDDQDFESVSVFDMMPSPSSVIAKRAEERVLLEALRRIPLDFQIALEFYYFENLRGPQIAEVLGVPEATVRSRLRRGLQHLRRQIEELASSPDVLESTLMNLDGWAQRVRERVDQHVAGHI